MFLWESRRWASAILAELAKMRTAIVLLGIAAALSAVGTWLPQGLAIEDYVNEWGVLWGQVFWYSGLTDVFRAWWYLALWAVLLASVSACLWRNGPGVWRWLVLPKRLPSLAGAAKLERIDDARLMAAGFRRTGIVEGYTLWEPAYWRGRLNRLGYFLVHIGVLGVAVAGLLSGLVGWRGTLNIREGDRDQVALLWRGREATAQPLPFTVTNKEFQIEFYDTGMPSRFASVLDIAEPGQSVRTVEAEVNKPVAVGPWWRRYTLYQASFGDGGSTVQGAGIDLSDGSITPFQGKIYDKATLRDGTRIELLDFRPFTVETFKGMRPTDVGASMDYLVQPPDREARQLRAYAQHPDIIGVADGQNSEGMVQYRAVPLGASLQDAKLWPLVAQVVGRPENFRDIMRPVLMRIDDPVKRVATGVAVLQAANTLRDLGVNHVVRLDDFTLRRYTGLQVAYDPGVPLFWVFSVLLSLGVMLMLGRRMVRLWVKDGMIYVNSPHGSRVIEETLAQLKP